MSAAWVDLPNGRQQLRVCDDHWYVVDGNRVVYAPSGLSRGRFATHEEALRQTERMYRESLERLEKRGEHLAMTARAGLHILARALSSGDATRPTGDGQ